MTTDGTMAAQGTPRRRRGCFFYGCITGLVMLLLLVIAILLGVHYVKKMVYGFTDDKPMTLPSVQLSQPELDNLKARIDAFDKAIKEKRPTSPLTLTSDEVNAYIATAPHLKELKGRVYVTLEGEQLKGQVSFPMPIFKGRYLNGAGSFTFSFKNGALRILPEDITVKGEPLPKNVMDQLRHQDLARDLNRNPEITASLENFEEIQIKDSKLIITPKQNTQNKEVPQ